ncbi:Uncharacterised protein [uncultured archaeon]|nr:Uncharacterised protein [uncultured archaeon]
MKKFVLMLLLCAVSVFAITTAITTSYDTCYDACKKECTQKYTAEKCVNICVLQCRTQPEPSLVDADVKGVTAVATQVITSQPAVTMRVTPLPSAEPMPVATAVAPQPPTVVPPVAYSCQDKCGMIRDECAKYNVDDASCKMKIDSCLNSCGSAGCPACICPDYGCETECVKGYFQCKVTGKSECSKIVVDCLDQCRPVQPVKCDGEKCKPQVAPQPTVTKVARADVSQVAKAEVREPIAVQKMPEPMPAKQGVWSKIMSFFKG